MTGTIASFSIDSREILDQPANNFTFNLRQSINLPDDTYEICLARGLMYYSWYNFIPALAPQDFTFNGNIYSLPAGNYSIITLELRIKDIIEAGGGNPDDFNMSKDYPTGKIRLDLLNGAIFSVDSPELSKMMGFPIFTPQSGIAYGDDYPDFEGENKRIFITHSLVAGNYNYINDATSRYIYEVRAPEKPAFTQFDVIEPNNIVQVYDAVRNPISSAP